MLTYFFKQLPSCPCQQRVHACFLDAQYLGNLDAGAVFHLSHVQHRVLGGRQVAYALLQPLLVLALHDDLER